MQIKSIQISLDAARLKRRGLTASEIQRLNAYLHREGFKILKVNIKPVGRRKEVTDG